VGASAPDERRDDRPGSRRQCPDPCRALAATKEQLGSYCLIDRNDLDEPIDRDYIANERLPTEGHDLRLED
jgi:hypothetical protein